MAIRLLTSLQSYLRRQSVLPSIPFSIYRLATATAGAIAGKAFNKKAIAIIVTDILPIELSGAPSAGIPKTKEVMRMKSQKRDTSVRAYKRGYQAGLYGKSKDACPLHQNADRQQWLTGWREGRQDNWDGLTGVSAISKLSKVLQ